MGPGGNDALLMGRKLGKGEAGGLPYKRNRMRDTTVGGQRPPLPKRKYIRLPREAYANPASTFNITIDALDRRHHFDIPAFNDEVIAILRGDRKSVV